MTTTKNKPAPIGNVIKRRISWQEFFKLRPDRAPPAAANDNAATVKDASMAYTEVLPTLGREDATAFLNRALD